MTCTTCAPRFLLPRQVAAIAFLLLLAGPALAQTAIVGPGSAAAVGAGVAINPLVMLLALLPPNLIPYATAAFSIATTVITAASIICAAFPPPTTTSGIWYWIFTIVNKLAVNFGHAASLAAPASAGIVGGPGATTAPLIATGVVPLVTATPAEKLVTIVPAVLPPIAATTAPPAADVIAGRDAAAAFEAKKVAPIEVAKPAGRMP